MGITARFTKADIAKDLVKFKLKVENDLFQILQYCGNEFVRDARLMTKGEGGFGDDTGNLRSSIGYFILKDGKIITENLRRASGATNKSTAEGKEAARSALGNVQKSQGYQLVGVAGMDYASEVESKGYNVIAAQKEIAIVNLNKRIKKYISKLNTLGVSFDQSGGIVTTEFAG